MLEYLLRGVSDNYTFTDVPREKKYSIERVTEEYLRMGVPYQKKNRQCTKVEKFIKKHWPSPKMVQEMYSRKRDVNRKTLLLLYLVTEGMGVEVSEKSFVLEHCKRMDMMLSLIHIYPEPVHISKSLCPSSSLRTASSTKISVSCLGTKTLPST